MSSESLSDKLEAWNGKWCTYCRADTHNDAECWCTRPADWHPGKYVPIEAGWLKAFASSSDTRVEMPPPGSLAEGFGDPLTLLNSRDWLEAAIVAKGARIIDSGCGAGQADLGFILEGCEFCVSLSPRLRAAGPMNSANQPMLAKVETVAGPAPEEISANAETVKMDWPRKVIARPEETRAPDPVAIWIERAAEYLSNYRSGHGAVPWAVDELLSKKPTLSSGTFRWRSFEDWASNTTGHWDALPREAWDAARDVVAKGRSDG